MIRPIRRRVRTLTAGFVLGTVLTVPAFGTTGHAAPAPTPVPATSGVLTTAQALDKAKASGRAVPVEGMTTATDSVVANPNRSLTLTRAAVPVRKRVGSGWQALDAALRRNADGTVTPAVTTGGLILSGGGSGPLATMTAGGRTLAVSLPVPLPAPVLAGATATYPGVLPGVDLQVAADVQGGFREVLVITDRTAAADPRLRPLTLATRATGLTVRTDAAGNIAATDPTGRAVFTASAPLMWDSATPPAGTDPKPGQPVLSTVSGPGMRAHTARVRATATTATAAGITLTPDAALLTDPATVFPVFLDPTFTPSAVGAGRGGWASVSEYYPSSNYWNATPDPQGYMQVGNSGSMWSHTLVNFPIDVGTLRGATILSASLSTTELYSFSCTATTVNLYAPATTLASSNATWNYWAGVNLGGVVAHATVAHGYNSSCPAAGVGFSIASTVAADVAAGKTTQTFALLGVNESTDHNSWKEFASAGSAAPTIQITYDHPPNIPTGLTMSPATACTGTPPTVIGDGAVYLYAPVSDPDSGQVGVRYELWKTAAPGTILASSDPNTLTAYSGTTATLIVPETTLKNATGGSITEFSWHVQVTDFYATGAWSVTCNFSLDPTRTGAPRIGDPGSTTIGQAVAVSINPPVSGTTPTSYLYQLNGASSATVPATNGVASVTIKPSRFTNVLTVTSLSAGGNIGDTATLVFNSTPPATPQADQDLTGDGLPDLITVGKPNALPPVGLWQASGSAANGRVNPVPVDIGANGNNLIGDNKAADFTAAQVITGHFTGSGLQDVLVYYPTGYYPNGGNAGGGVILNGSGDGSVLQAQNTANADPITAGIFTDGNGDNPIQLANAGNTAGLGLAYPDLIGTAGDPTYGYHLDYYPDGNQVGGYATVDSLTGTPTPTGAMDWDKWTISTAQVASGTQMFLWNKGTGALYLWTNLSHTVNGGTLGHTQYTVAASGWHTNESLSLQAADLNNDGTADLWTVGTGAAVTAYLVTLSGSTATASAQSGQTLDTANHSWPLNDAISGTVTTAADATGNLPATGTGDVVWHGGDLYDPDAAFNGTPGGGGVGALSTSGPAVSTDADFTVSVWVKPTATGGAVLSEDGTQAAGFVLWAEPADNSWRFAMPTSDVASPAYDVAAAPAGSVTLGAWTRLVASYQRSTGTMTLYIDGSAAATGSHVTTWHAGGHFQIGDRLNAGTHTGYLVGQVANAQTWNLTIDPNGGVVPAGTSLIQPGGPDATRVKADFNGDGLDDLALFYYYGASHVSVWTMTGVAGGGFTGPTLRWDGPNWGGGTKFVTAGDFNGDGKADLALFYDYGANHVSVWTMTGGTGGALGAPVLRWDDTVWGENTKFVTAGDFNGDGKADLALFYDYGASHAAVWTMNGSSTGALSGPVDRWDDLVWGEGTRFLGAGDFNGDGKTDLALFYDYGANHVALFTMTAAAGGALGGPTLGWDDAVWGGGTQLMSVGNDNGDSRADVSLLYNYGGSHVTLFSLSANGTGGFNAPTTVWDGPAWGGGTKFMTSGKYSGASRDDIAMFYDYGSGHVALFTLNPSGTTGYNPPVTRWDDTVWGSGTLAVE